jgi:hypothetical protein
MLEWAFLLLRYLQLHDGRTSMYAYYSQQVRNILVPKNITNKIAAFLIIAIVLSRIFLDWNKRVN